MPHLMALAHFAGVSDLDDVLPRSIFLRLFQQVPATGNFQIPFYGVEQVANQSVRLFRWEEMEKEPVTDVIDRRVVSGEKAMVAHVYLTKGAVVPTHSHENEQFTYILEGALRFWIGEDGGEELVVRAGEILHIPSNVPHKAEALEDTLDVDVFSPPRQDWLDGTDNYFHDGDK
ncbi:MAG: cupin domain-containing protein [Gemmatimonadota bacterium]|nr:cupin domain-containing protein [Gemmatimonadota bacterium]